MVNGVCCLHEAENIGAPIFVVNRPALTFLAHATGVYKTLAERCVEAREDIGLGQADAAKRLGLKQPSLSAIETGETKTLRATTAKAMVKVYSVRLPWLVDGEGPKRDADAAVVAMRRPEVLDETRYQRLRLVLDEARRHKLQAAFYGEFDGMLARWENHLRPRRGSQGAGSAIPRQKPAKRRKAGDGG